MLRILCFFPLLSSVYPANKLNVNVSTKTYTASHEMRLSVVYVCTRAISHVDSYVCVCLHKTTVQSRLSLKTLLSENSKYELKAEGIHAQSECECVCMYMPTVQSTQDVNRLEIYHLTIIYIDITQCLRDRMRRGIDEYLTLSCGCVAYPILPIHLKFVPFDLSLLSLRIHCYSTSISNEFEF